MAATTKQRAQQPTTKVEKPHQATAHGLATVKPEAVTVVTPSPMALPSMPSYPTNRAMRQTAVLNLQQQQGNAAVQRIICSRTKPLLSSSPSVVQRTPSRYLINQIIAREHPVENENGEIQDVITTGTSEQLQLALDRLLEIRDREQGQLQTFNRNPRETRRARLLLRAVTPYIHLLRTRLANRGNSRLADANIELHFNGSHLRVEGALTQSLPAVSGKPDTTTGQFDYSRRNQQRENQGPIPEGTYWLDVSELQNRWYSMGENRDAWGSHRIPIHPFDSTHTFGRGGFFIHGGSIPGSIGCIDLTNRMGELAEILARYSNVKVKLHVHYPHR